MSCRNYEEKLYVLWEYVTGDWRCLRGQTGLIWGNYIWDLKDTMIVNLKIVGKMVQKSDLVGIHKIIIVGIQA